jgi:hypothetical protein
MLLDVDGRIVRYETTGPEERVDITFMYAFETPRILRGLPPLAVINWPMGDIWVNYAIGREVRDLALTRGASKMRGIADFHPELFSKMLAKIGYSFAVAEAGLDRFEPLIPAAIIGKEPWYTGYLVGGEPNPVERSEYQSEVGLRRVTSATGDEYLMARIRVW